MDVKRPYICEKCKTSENLLTRIMKNMVTMLGCLRAGGLRKNNLLLQQLSDRRQKTSQKRKSWENFAAFLFSPPQTFLKVIFPKVFELAQLKLKPSFITES